MPRHSWSGKAQAAIFHSSGHSHRILASRQAPSFPSPLRRSILPRMFAWLMAITASTTRRTSGWRSMVTSSISRRTSSGSTRGRSQGNVPILLKCSFLTSNGEARRLHCSSSHRLLERCMPLPHTTWRRPLRHNSSVATRTRCSKAPRGAVGYPAPRGALTQRAGHLCVRRRETLRSISAPANTLVDAAGARPRAR